MNGGARMTEEHYAAYKAKRAREARDVELSVQLDAIKIPGVPKYGNVKTNGYDSKREATRAEQLKWMLHFNVIRDLREQVKYLLIPKQEGERALSYIADFVYFDSYDKLVVEDAKGHRTRDYIIKRKLMKFVHGITIREV